MKGLKILSLLMALLLVAGALTACSGNSDKKAGEATTQAQEEAKAAVHDGWYYANVPDGFKAADEEETEFDGPDGMTIKVTLRKTFSDTPDAAAFAQQKLDDYYTAGEDVTIGNYTFKTVNFKWDNDADSQSLYADVYDGYVAEFTLFCMTSETAEAKAFLESFGLVDGNPDDNQQAFLQELYS